MFTENIIPNPFKSKNIAFEGIDGSGKSTNYTRIQDLMGERYPEIGITYTKEPGSNRFFGRQIYQILNGEHPSLSLPRMGKSHFQAFYVEDRIENHRVKILPAHYRGEHVFQDRTALSSVCYGAESPEDFDDLFGLHDRIFSVAGIPLIWPDKIIIFGVPAEVAVERLNRPDRSRDVFEQIEKLERVRSNYLAFAGLHPELCCIIDGQAGVDEVFRYTKEEVFKVLGIRT